jgi:hypothetical protein
MAMDSDEHKEFVIYRFGQIESKLDEISGDLKSMRHEFSGLRTELEVVKVKGGFFGGLMGALGAALMGLASWLMK